MEKSFFSEIFVADDFNIKTYSTVIIQATIVFNHIELSIKQNFQMFV